MNHFLRFLQVFALGTWVGSIIYFSAVVAQGAFRVLATVDDAGRLVGFTLGGLHWLGVIAAVVYLAASVLLERSIKPLAKPAAAGVIAMLMLTLVSQRIVIPRMDVLRAEMGSTSATNPLRVEFDRLHGISVNLEGTVLLIGIASLLFTVRTDRPQPGFSADPKQDS
jgi:uncharacterized membrane protein YciS (DUF1049 family)